MGEIKIVLAESQDIARMGICSILQHYPEFRVVAEAADRNELIAALAYYKPDLLIMDYNAPGYFAIDDMRRITSHYPAHSIVIISADNSKANINHVLKMGIRNFLTKECDKNEVIDAVRAACQGQTFFCRKIVNRVLENSAGGIPETNDCRPVSLSVRELDIVRLIGKGYTTKEIADKVFLSPHTIGTHRKNIFRKLGVKSASELLMYSIRSGLIEAGE